MNESRNFPRIKKRIKIEYELVKFRYDILSITAMTNSFLSTNISARGIGIDSGFDITPRIENQLFKGKKKIKIQFSLDNDSGNLIVAFARPAWSEEKRNVNGRVKSWGLMLIDISPTEFRTLNNYIEEEIKRGVEVQSQEWKRPS